MLFELLLCCFVFVTTLVGLGWPVARRLPLDAPEKFLATAALSLATVFVVSWGWYLSGLSLVWLWGLPLLAGLGLSLTWRSFIASLLAPDVRPLWRGQLLVTSWCLGWLALISTYSGGGWTGDWFEHWERAKFFLDRGAHDTVFIGHAAVTARPPLANVLTAAFLAVTHIDFARYQIFSTLLASVAFLPAALLARRFVPRAGGEASTAHAHRAVALLAVLVMVNPLFVQNATFAWTKLPAAFFALTGVYFFLEALRAERPLLAASLSACFLAAGILAHYSIGPYVVVLAVAWLVVSWRRQRERAWWHATGSAITIGAAVLGTWFGWALVTYGAAGALLDNTSIHAADRSGGGQFFRIALNIRDTLVPYFLRPMDMSLIAQASPWGTWRDRFFQLYQTNLLFAFGSVGWVAVLFLLGHAHRRAAFGVRVAGWGLIGGALILGIAVHGARDTWGLVHICLQPLVITGLAFLAANAANLSRRWRPALIAGAGVDLMLGIVLHFAVQNLAFERWAGPNAFARWQADNSTGAVMNMTGKLQHQLVFLNDAWALPFWLTLLLLAALLVVAIRPIRAGTKF